MGDYLATPAKEKQSEEAENGKVSLFLVKLLFRYVMAYLKCKVGGGAWRMRIFATSTLGMASRYLGSSMAMEVSHFYC